MYKHVQLYINVRLLCGEKVLIEYATQINFSQISHVSLTLISIEHRRIFIKQDNYKATPINHCWPVQKYPQI